MLFFFFFTVTTITISSYLVVRDPRLCQNSHRFCASCIATWSLTPNGDNNLKCPVCRAPGRYRPDFRLDYKLRRSAVKCLEINCDWKGLLKEYDSHLMKQHDVGEPPPASDDFKFPSITHTGNGASYGIHNAPVPHPGSQIPTWIDRGRHVRDSTSNRLDRDREALHFMFLDFERQLAQRGRSIRWFHETRERDRLDRLREMESLGRRLDQVGGDIMQMLTDMEWDGRRYRDYIRSSEDLEESLVHLRQNISDVDSPRPAQTSRLLQTYPGRRSGTSSRVTQRTSREHRNAGTYIPNDDNTVPGSSGDSPRSLLSQRAIKGESSRPLLRNRRHSSSDSANHP